LTPRSLSEVDSTGEEHIFQTVHMLGAQRPVHSVEDFSESCCNILACALLEHIDNIAIEEVENARVLVKASRIDIIR
jgi:hypothetical protein